MLFLFPEIDLALAGKVDGLAEEASGFLRGMKSHGVFRIDEVDAPLRFALKPVRRFQSLLVCACGPGGGNRQDQVDRILVPLVYD